MKNFNTPAWEGNKIGDKASEAFTNAGKLKTKASKAKKPKKEKENKVAQVSKTIKKKSPVKKQKTSVTKAVKQTASPRKSPKVKVTQATPKQDAKGPKVKSPNVKSSKLTAKLSNISPKAPKSPKSKVEKPTKGKGKVKSPVKKVTQTNGNSPRAPKRKISSPVTPAKVQTVETPKKSAKSNRLTKTKSPQTSPIKKTKSPGKKVPVKTTPIRQKSPRQKQAPQTPTTSPKNKKSPAASASPQKQKKSANKLSPTSVVIKKVTKKKAVVKTKIKLAGLLGRKLPAALNGTSRTPKSRQNAKNLEKISKALAASGTVTKKVRKSRGGGAASVPLRVKMMDRLQSARFRYINEELYTKDSAGAVKLFEEDPEAFAAYHDGYRQQVKKWPLNPLTKIIASIQKMPQSMAIADFGCGEAELARSVKQKVHSFDLVAANDTVTACDMAHVPIGKHSVDVAVFCLSLMGTNLQDYLLEANRVLKVGGMLMIAEVESRFDKVDAFITGLSRYGFANVHKDFEHNLFYLMHFRKERDLKSKKNLPTMSLHPCIYKKR